MPALRTVVREAEDLILVDELLGCFLFRGHANADWGLSSTLERRSQQWGVEPESRHERELSVISAFKRRAHHYIPDPPDSSQWVEWAALLQHYGGPTRLVDVTKSLLIATYFAIEDATEDAVVWAFNRGKLMATGGGPAYDEDIIQRSKDEGAKVLAIEPFRMNKRLALQQGAFLLPESIHHPFAEQLVTTLNCPLDRSDDWDPRANEAAAMLVDFCRIEIPKDSHSRLMRFLSRSNVSAATLFENLEGFARSLRTMMRIHD